MLKILLIRKTQGPKNVQPHKEFPLSPFHMGIDPSQIKALSPPTFAINLDFWNKDHIVKIWCFFNKTKHWALVHDCELFRGCPCSYSYLGVRLAKLARAQKFVASCTLNQGYKIHIAVIYEI